MLRVRPDLALTFDDVLLIPQRSPVRSRSDVSTRTRFSRRIDVELPIVSANMDTVTEWQMAVAMARAGGIGIVHRFMTAEREAEEIKRVKRAESHIVEHPYTLGPEATAEEAATVMDRRGIGGLVVIDERDRALGIVTQRDLHLAVAGSLVRDLMTPAARLITAPAGTSLEDARRILHEHRIEKLPLVDGEGRLVGLITTKDITNMLQHPHATKDAKGRLRVGAAVGVQAGFLERAALLLQAGADTLVVDIAHGHSDNAISSVRALRREFGDIEIVAGNVATAEGTCDLIQAGADAIKVGVGPGSICITRIVTGFGVPQLTAISECAEAAAPSGIPIIADGGIRTSGDVAKALAAGADSVMVGSLLAGTEESPGLIMTRGGHRYKASRGMASLGSKVVRKAREGEGWITQEEISDYVSEGVEAAVPYKGAVKDALAQLTGGLRSGMSYCGAHSLAELQEKAVLVQMTSVGLAESMPHDVDVL